MSIRRRQSQKCSQAQLARTMLQELCHIINEKSDSASSDQGKKGETAGESVVVDSDFESAKWAAEEKRRWQETTGSWGTFNMQQSSSLPLSLPTCVCVCSLCQGVCVFAKWKWKSSHGLVTKANKRAERASSYLFGNCSLLFIVVRVCGGCCCFCYCCCLRLGIAHAPPAPAPASTTTWTGHPNHSAS